MAQMYNVIAKFMEHYTVNRKNSNIKCMPSLEKIFQSFSDVHVSLVSIFNEGPFYKQFCVQLAYHHEDERFHHTSVKHNFTKQG